MSDTLPIVKLSRQAGRILRHLTWLPNEVIEIINKFPYHSARIFAAGMDYALKRQINYTYLDVDDPIQYLSSSSYGYTLNIKEFVGVIPTGTTGLLLSVGSIAELGLIDNKDLKKVLVPGNQYLQWAITQYNGFKSVFPDLRRKKVGISYFAEPSIGKWIEILIQAIDAGASDLAGLKECYLAARYYERAYNRVNLDDSHFYRWIDALNYELPPFPDTVEIKEGDKFIFDKPEVRYEKNWPDILLREGKYSIVHHLSTPEYHTITTPNTSNYEDIRMAESNINEMACFILCKREGKWGAVFSDRSHYFFILVVPYIYETPEEVAKEVNKFIDIDNDTRWVNWDDFKGLINHNI